MAQAGRRAPLALVQRAPLGPPLQTVPPQVTRIPAILLTVGERAMTQLAEVVRGLLKSAAATRGWAVRFRW